MRARPGKCVLVTGFEPFGGERINPSWEIVRALPEAIGGRRIEKLLVPTEFGRSIRVATEAIDRLEPEFVLGIGQAKGDSWMSVERVAVNENDALFCTLPVKAMVAAITKAGIPAEVSDSAGTFVCNHLIYGVLEHIEARALAVRAGFMHVPFVEAQVLDKPDTPAMALASMVAGTKAAIMAAIKEPMK